MLSFFRIATIDEDAVHQLLLFFLGFPVLQEKVRLFHGHLRLLPAGLENRGLNVALLEYRVARVVAAVEADNNHVVFYPRLSAPLPPPAPWYRCRKSRRRYPDSSAEWLPYG